MPGQAQKELVIYFCGTRNPVLENPQRPALSGKNVDALYIKGCEHKWVCNTGLFPNLNKLAAKLAGALRADDKSLCPANELVVRLNENRLSCQEGQQDPEDFKNYEDSNAALLDVREAEKRDIPYRKIKLMGFSRGAVTAFLLAEKMHSLEIKVPVEIEVVEPVSGNLWQRGVAKAAGNLAHCDNIKKATIVLGAYRKNPFFRVLNFLVNFFHRLVFTQLVPKFHPATVVDVKTKEKRGHHWVDQEEEINGYRIYPLNEPLKRPNDLMPVFGKFSQRVHYSMCKKPADGGEQSTQAFALNLDEVKLKNELVIFAMEMQNATSWAYGVRLFRSCRKEDYFQILEYEFRSKQSVTTDEATQYLKEILSTAAIQRGYHPQTTSSEKAAKLLKDDDRFQELRLISKSLEETHGVSAEEGKVVHYGRRLSLT